MSHLISPPEVSDWSMLQSQFESALTSKWPKAKGRERRGPHFSREWIWEIDAEEIVVALDDEGIYVDVDADSVGLAEFAIWFRSIVPASQPLIMYDEGYNTHMDLAQYTTLADVLQVFGDP